VRAGDVSGNGQSDARATGAARLARGPIEPVEYASEIISGWPDSGVGDSRSGAGGKLLGRGR
jgi:hypothetical protein